MCDYVYQDHIEVLSTIGGGVSPDKVSQILSFASTLKSDEATTMGLQDFPMDNLRTVIKIMVCSLTKHIVYIYLH